MPLVLADRVRDTTTTTGTGTVTLSGTAPTGYQNFSVIGNGNTTYYTINAGSQWEVGIGTYSSAGPTLARNTVLESSNANALVDFVAGVKDVFVTYPSDKSVNYDENNNVGIGTTTPADKLDVRNDTSNTRLRISTSDNGNIFYAGWRTGASFIAAAGYNSPVLAFDTGGSERARFDTVGNFLVGTTTAPAGGTVSAVFAKAATTNLQVHSTDGGGALYGGIGGGGALIYTYTGAVGSETYTERMRVTSAGNVGINISNPSVRFSVSGDPGDPTLNAASGIAEFRLSSTQMLAIGGYGSGSFGVWLQGKQDNSGYTNNTWPIILQPSGGNVGIGTASPVTRLQVETGADATAITCSANSSTSSVLRLGIGGFAAGVPSITGTGNGLSLVASDAAPMRFGTSNTERMRIDSSGNVGIGSVPGVRFQITHDQAAYSYFDYYNTTNAGGIVWRQIVRNLANTGNTSVDFAKLISSGFAINNNDNNAANFTSFGIGGAERMRIDSSGNVGIGTTAGAARLRVSAGGRIDAPVLGNVTNYPAFISSNDSAYGLGIGTNGSTGHVWLQAQRADSAVAYNITLNEAGGNVGIGTSAPSARLDVRSGAGTDNVIASRAGNAAYMVLQGTSFPTFNQVQSYDGSGNLYWAIGGSGTANTLAFLTNGSNERMRIDSSGNVGIGTSSPQRRLQVSVNAAPGAAQSAKTGLLIQNLDSSGTGGSPSTAAIQFAFDPATPRAYIEAGTFGNDLLAFGLGGAERMRIDSSGNLLVGTTGTTYGTAGRGLIEVNGSSTALIAIKTGDTARGYFAASSSATELSAVGASQPLLFTTNAAERMRIDSSGNVGIGTSSPNAKVEIFSNGPPAASGNMNTGTVFAAAAGSQSLNVGATAAGNYAWLNAGYQNNSGIATPMVFLTGATERMRIDSSGNVSIGTTAGYGGYGSGRGLTLSNQSSLIFQNASNTWNSTTAGGAVTYFSDNNMYIDAKDSGSNVIFRVNGTSERARINSSGEFLVGTSSGGRTVCVNATDNWIRQSNPSRSWLIGPSVSTSYTIFDETAGAARFTIDTAGVWNGPNAIVLGQGQNLDNRIELGSGRTGNNFAYVDLIGDTTYTDFGLRLLRGNTGPNAISQLVHRGTGDMYITAQDAATMYFQTNSATRAYFQSDGTMIMNGSLLIGRQTSGSNVNTNNDTGSFSVRGDGSNAASMSFHRIGAFAINMGLGTDAVFRIGGWSASSNCFQMDASGNLTMLGNVTAYSDARIKKDVETIGGALDLVSKMRGVRFTRIDTDKRGVGVIAQEMLEIMPEVVQQGMGDDDTLSVAYGNLVGVLIEAIKELRAEVAELKGK